ncbi:hypothetical protein A5482_014790 (plasmid) [Cyanobacterium sp. IPPAS B-1200]|uniref:hypothetical protein n=1 Tax=Cyanobacterium sp. IPPAS B-1200 TaxID=1562720 RepID=UPI001372C9ED|nr:hypothetical protein [Cyanobacterium sp. IPPAS B-1200]
MTNFNQILSSCTWLHQPYVSAVRDRLVLKEGIPTVRFTAKECFNQPKRVVEEFLGLF